MDPAMLIPKPDTIPVHWGWFQSLLILTFMVHILLMNAMLGTGIIALVHDLRRPYGKEPASHAIADNLTYLIAFTINFGVAPLLFLQVLYGQFMYTSSVLMAVYWLSVIGLIILSYYSAYVYSFKYESLGSGRVWFLGFTVLTLLAVGFIYTNNTTLMLSPKAWTSYFTEDGGTILNLYETSLFPRYLHFMVASIAVGGLFMAGRHALRKEKGGPEAEKWINRGMLWFTFGTAAETGIGIVFLFSLPEPVKNLFVGGSLLHTSVFLLGLVGVFFCLVYGMRGKVWRATYALLVTVFLMIMVRDLVRQAYLAPYFKPADLVLAPQYSPMIVFLVSLVIGLAAVAYMLKLAVESGREVRK